MEPNVGALLIRMWFWGHTLLIIRNLQNSIGNYSPHLCVGFLLFGALPPPPCPPSPPPPPPPPSPSPSPPPSSSSSSSTPPLPPLCSLTHSLHHHSLTTHSLTPSSLTHHALTHSVSRTHHHHHHHHSLTTVHHHPRTTHSLTQSHALIIRIITHSPPEDCKRDRFGAATFRKTVNATNTLSRRPSTGPATGRLAGHHPAEDTNATKRSLGGPRPAPRARGGLAGHRPPEDC